MIIYHDDNMDDGRLEALFGEALGDVPTDEETAEALHRFRCNRVRHSHRWLYYAAAILFLPLIVIAVPVIFSHTGLFSTSPQPTTVETEASSSAVPCDAPSGNAAVQYFEYDNIPFCDALDGIASHYGLTVISSSTVSLSSVRIHFRCRCDLSAAEVLEALNDLQIVCLRLESTTIFVEDIPYHDGVNRTNR